MSKTNKERFPQRKQRIRGLTLFNSILNLTDLLFTNTNKLVLFHCLTKNPTIRESVSSLIELPEALQAWDAPSCLAIRTFLELLRTFYIFSVNEPQILCLALNSGSGCTTLMKWKLRSPLSQSWSAPGLQRADIRQLFPCVLRVAKTWASTQAPLKNKEGRPSALKGACDLIELVQVSGLVTPSALCRAHPKSLLQRTDNHLDIKKTGLG
ncbi:hypothetical protein RF11_11544 [Thelohanellus kitauei]|uniref:Uncharacterized protein n=1 Tax=Thelohanellus kitauei TaxID=669202 RepID=A0A0C2MW73_THEKT|nr:hypothetical protein RF11_11544 [Thelohanellus kitauei]